MFDQNSHSLLELTDNYQGKVKVYLSTVGDKLKIVFKFKNVNNNIANDNDNRPPVV